MLEPYPEADAIATHAEGQPFLTPDAGYEGGQRDSDPAAAPDGTALRVCAAMLSFFVMGIRSSAMGVLIPYMEPYYNINDTMISLLFVIPLSGYLIASLMNDTIHVRFGRRGIAWTGSLCQLLVIILAAAHPPYAVLLLASPVAGFGAGLIDAGWGAWAAGLRNANTVSGFLHGSYSAGATVGPYLTACLVAGGGWQWYSFHRLMTVVAIIQAFVLPWAFWHDTGAMYLSEKAQAPDSGFESSSKMGMWKHRVIYICAAYLIAYVGAEAILGGWIVTFMLRIRAASPFSASLCASGFWAGMALGRLTLGSVTDRFGERLSVTLYLLAALAAEALFSLVAPVLVALASMALLGFFLGPIFPTGIVMLTRLMPRELHVGAVAAVNAVGQVGGAVFPFVLGATADRLGIQALQPFVFVLLLLALVFWRYFPRLPPRKAILQPVELEEENTIVRSRQADVMD